MDARQAREWHMVLGTRDSETAAAELKRLGRRLDDGFECINYVLRLVAGSPDGELEETLRVARTAVNESVQVLNRAATEFGRDTDAA